MHQDIIPCLLPEDRPDISLLWLDFERSRSSYARIWEFDFVPLGLFNHLLIKLLHLTNVHRYWRNGLVFSKDDDWALCEVCVLEWENEISREREDSLQAIEREMSPRRNANGTLILSSFFFVVDPPVSTSVVCECAIPFCWSEVIGYDHSDCWAIAWKLVQLQCYAVCAVLPLYCEGTYSPCMMYVCECEDVCMCLKHASHWRHCGIEGIVRSHFV